MKGFGAGLIVLVAVVLAGCGGDNTTTFVLDSGSPSASASSSAKASPSTNASAAPASSSLPSTAATPIPGSLKVIIDSPDASTAISSPVEVSGTASVDKGTVVGVDGHASGGEIRAQVGPPVVGDVLIRIAARCQSAVEPLECPPAPAVVVRGAEDQPSAWLQYAVELAEYPLIGGDVLDHFGTDHAIERGVLEGQVEDRAMH